MSRSNCLRSEIKHSSSRRLVQAVTEFGCSLPFQLKDFIATFRIVFRMKCHPTEDVGMYFLLETKMQGKGDQVARCKATCFWSPNYPLAKHFSPLQSFSLLGWLVDDDLYRIRLLVLSSRFYNLSRKFKSLKQSSFYKFAVEPFGLRCCSILSWKYVGVAGLYATTILRQKAWPSDKKSFSKAKWVKSLIGKRLEIPQDRN